MCLKTASTQQEVSNHTLKVKGSLTLPAILLAVLALSYICVPGAAFAQSSTWTDASGVDANWSTAANWSNGVPLPSTDVTVPAGPLAPYVDVSPEIKTLTLNGGQVRLGNGITLKVDGSQIIDNGSLVLNNGGLGQTTLLLGGGSLTLSGSGVLAMSDQPNNVIDGPSGGTLINNLSSTQGIFGSGNIGNGHLTLQNFGTINANNTQNALVIGSGPLPNTPVTNMGTLEASGGGTLYLLESALANAGGSIQANNGTVKLFYDSISGGVLSTSGGGLITPTTSDATLADLTNTGRYVIGDGSGTILEGTITNTGTIALNCINALSKLMINGSVTLTGSGSVVMSNCSGNKISGSGTITNQQTIQGAGTINVASFLNQGTVNANQSIPLTIQSAATGGNYTAIEGGSFNFDGGALNNATATASGGSFSLINNTTWSNTVTTGSGQFMTHSAKFSNCTNSGGVYMQDGDSLTLAGTFTDNGSVTVSPVNQDALLVVDGPVTLSGSGTVKLQVNGAGATPRIKGATGNDSLTNYGTIQGGGFIGNNSMNLINGLTGKIIANSTWPMNIETGFGHFTQNLGDFEIDLQTTAILNGILKNYNASTHAFSSGSWGVGGILQADNLDIHTNSAKITLAGQFVDQNNNNGFRNLAFQKGILNLAAPGTFGSNFSIQGPVLTNTGKLTVQKGRTLSLLDSASSYNQVGGTTVVDGTLDVSSTGLVNVTGGSLAVNGTVNGNLSVGNPTVAAGAFVVGDSPKKPGLANITGNYTQVATGTMDVQIAGATAGTQYSQLNVTGPVSLNGTLNIATVKYSPVAGQTFIIINSPSGITGTFSVVNGTTINTTKKYVVSYTPQTVVLTVQ